MDSTLKSFIPYDENHHFPLENIPFGCYHAKDGKKHCCTRIGDKLIDLALLFPKFDGEHFASLKGDNVFLQDDLNKFAALGKNFRIEARATIQKLFTQGNEALIGDDLLAQAVLPIDEQKMAMPVFIRDYTDFYSSKNHAHNIGVMFRGVDNALQPNWLHVPVGYHGRASSIVLDGTPITRPRGQTSADGKIPGFNNCRLMDFELEMGTIISQGNEQGCPIKIGDARDHIFGFCLLNDWSARDIQKWEYVPLGPFLAKNFASTISPWIVTPEALEPFKTAIPAQDPEVLPYLQDKDLHSYDLNLEVHIKSPQMTEWHCLTKSNMKYLYYSVAQTITHHAVTGCNMSTGDLLGSGTISSPEESGYGSMVELCWGGKKVINLPDGSERKFLLDGDEVNLHGYAKGNGYSIGFGGCSGKVLPCKDDSFYF